MPDVSRLLVESIEKRRLAGYTEKSQKYVTFGGDYVRPKEFSAEDLKKFEELVANTFAENQDRLGYSRYKLPENIFI